jgi:short-subunit dehydrogenase
MNGRNNNLLMLLAAGGGALLAARALARRANLFSFRDRAVLITGGSRGLGLVMARLLAGEGARLAICARDEQELERAREDLAGLGASALAIRCDVTDRAQVEEMVSRVEDHFGQIDVLINNAGVIEVGPMDVMTVRDYEEAMSTHFWGPLYTTLAVLPAMRRRGQGRIVNVSSIGGKISVPHLLPYSASKFALTGFSEGLRAELRGDGVVVTTVCPGLMRTGSPYNATFKGKHRQEFAWFSISDSLPFVTISAERAARQIIEACRRGDAEIVLTVPARLAALFHGVFPGLTADLMGLLNLLLPEPGGIGTARAKGADSQSAFSPSWLTALSDKAALENNEMITNEV